LVRGLGAQALTLRIAQIDPSLFTWPYDSALSLALVNAGHDVRLIGRPPRPNEEQGAALELLVPHFYRSLELPIAAKLPRKAFLAWKGVSHTYGMARLLPALRAFRPDVIHFQWSPLPAVDRRFVPSLKRIAKTVLTVHDSSPFNGAPVSSAQLAGAISIMSSFDRVIVHTEAAKIRLLGYGLPAEHISRVAHGLLDRYPLSETQNERRPGAPVEILMFGYLKPYKGIDVLLRAAAAMSREALERTHILIIGKPMMDLTPIRQMISDLQLAEHVTLEARFVPDKEVGDLFARADVVALPYREIDASGVLMTAITAGIPVVASRLGLIAEMLEDGRHGRLTPPGDYDSLADALEEVVVSDELRATMSRNIKALHASTPDWDTIARQTIDLYQELIGPSDPTGIRSG
jgi:glycosyltransferase involved in cell wall biosynthesis